MYLVQLTFPFAWVFLRRPSIAATGLAVIGINLAAAGNPFTIYGYHEIQSHYSLVLVAPLAMGTVYALAAIDRRRVWFVATIGVTALVASYLWAALPWGRDGSPHDLFDDAHAVAAREALALIPDDAIVSADWALTPHLARRQHVYFPPNPYHTRLYGAHDTFYGSGGNPPPGTRLPISDRLEYVVIGPPHPWRTQEHVDAWEREKHAFDLILDNGYYEVYRRSTEDAR